MKGRTLFLLVAVVAFVATAYPLLIPIAAAGVLSSVFYPLYLKLKSRLPDWLSSLTLTTAITFLLLLPASFLIFSVARLTLQQVGKLEKWRFGVNAGEASILEELFQSETVNSVLDQIGVLFPIDAAELLETTEALVRAFGVKLADILGQFVTQLPGMAIAIAVIVVGIFFFLLDGDRLVRWIEKNSFYRPRETKRIMQTYTTMCRSVLLASFTSATVQALVFLIAMIPIGVEHLWLVTFLVFLTAFIPLVGSVPVTLSVSIYFFLTGGVMAGMVLLIVGIFVTMLDNFIRPAVIKGSGNLHPLLAFIAAFGGIQVMGLAGIFLGPIIVGLVLEVLTIHSSTASSNWTTA